MSMWDLWRRDFVRVQAFDYPHTKAPILHLLTNKAEVFFFIFFAIDLTRRVSKWEKGRKNDLRVDFILMWNLSWMPLRWAATVVLRGRRAKVASHERELEMMVNFFGASPTRLYNPPCPSVGRLFGSTHSILYLSKRSLVSLLLPKCSSDLLDHCPCPPACD